MSDDTVTVKLAGVKDPATAIPFGPLCVHLRRGEWRVTHTKTGRGFDVGFPWKDGALRFAREVLSEFPGAWDFDEPPKHLPLTESRARQIEGAINAERQCGECDGAGGYEDQCEFGHYHDVECRRCDGTGWKK